MPNWIEGTLKLRGTSENLKRFFEEGLEGDVMIVSDFENKYFEVNFSEEPWVKDSHRAFITDDYTYWTNTNDEENVVTMAVRQAWCFNEEDWVRVSKDFNIDVRLFGFECGMQFTEELEVIKGNLTMDDTIKYDDWDWECPMPRMGG